MFVVMLGLLLVASACGGGGGGESPSPEETESAATSPTPEENGEGTDAASELQSLGAEWANTPAHVTYHYVGGESGTEDLGDFTLFWSPPDAYRMDITTSGASTTFIQNGKNSYVCGGAGSNACLALPVSQGGAGAIPFLGTFTDPEGLESEISSLTAAGGDVETSSETIAGEDASCYSVSGRAGAATGTAEWCFSSDGILLRYRGGSTGPGGATSFGLEATELSRDVSEADFEPPYEVQQIPTGGGG